MHLPSLNAPVRSEATEGLSPSPTPAKTPGAADTFFATCMDHALAHSQAPQAPQKANPGRDPLSPATPTPILQDGDANLPAKEGRGVNPIALPPAACAHAGEQSQGHSEPRDPATLPPTVVPNLAPNAGSDSLPIPLPAAQGKSPQASAEEEDPDGKEEGAANFAQQSPSNSTPPAILEAMVIQLLATAPNPAPPPPPALPQTGNASEAVDLTAGVATELPQRAQPGLAMPLGVPAASPAQSPAQALQMLQPIADTAPGHDSSSPAATAHQSQPSSRSLQAALGKDSAPAQSTLRETSLSTMALPGDPAEWNPQPAPAANPGLIVPDQPHIQAPTAPVAAEPAAPVTALGTAAAQQQVPMKKAEKMLKSADPAQQKLPGEVVLPEARQELTGSAVSAERLASVVFSTAPVEGALTPASFSASTTTPLGGTDARLHSLERTQDLVALHAVRLRESGAESLRVVLEPGAGLNLSLELRWREGNIEAQATLNRGDFAYLNQHWADLQQRLEPRGVHLASLESAVSSGSGSEHFSQSQQQFTQEDASASAFADFAFGDSMTDSPAARRSRAATPHRGWETWA